ncbi:hypothetical protein BHE74_00040411 [Ensete ventricosum]|nr:hypothetical protein BHE74_00040411 [Ensete ventricosum]
MEHRAEARSFPWTEVKGMNSCRGKSGIMSFHEFFILIGRTYLAWCRAKGEGSFEAHAPYLIDAFDGVTKVIQLAKAKLGSRDLTRGKRMDRGPGSRQWCTNSSERQVFVYASELALDETLVISIWGLHTAEEEVQVQVLVSPMEGDIIMLMIRSCWELHFGEQCTDKKGCEFKE